MKKTRKIRRPDIGPKRDSCMGMSINSGPKVGHRLVVYANIRVRKVRGIGANFRYELGDSRAFPRTLHPPMGNQG